MLRQPSVRGRRFGDADILPLLLFLVNTGARRGEAIALEWENVDFERRLIRIWASDEWQPKDEDNREVPISDALLPWLQRLHDEPDRGRWVFQVTQGKTKGDRFAFWPQRRFDAIRKAAGLKGGPHTSRHTFATHFLARCPDLFLLARLLGHSSARVTELYSHLLPDHLARVRSVVNLGSPVSPAALAAAERWAVGADAAARRRGRFLRKNRPQERPQNPVALDLAA